MVDNVCHLCTGNAIDHRAAAMIHGKSRGEATVQVYAADARSRLPHYSQLLTYTPLLTVTNQTPRISVGESADWSNTSTVNKGV
jgi:hypothetical protein